MYSMLFTEKDVLFKVLIVTIIWKFNTSCDANTDAKWTYYGAHFKLMVTGHDNETTAAD